MVGTNKKEEITFSLFNSTSKNFIDIDNLSIFWMVTENAIIGRENQLKPNVQCNDHPSVFFHRWFMYSGDESRWLDQLWLSPFCASFTPRFVTARIFLQTQIKTRVEIRFSTTCVFHLGSKISAWGVSSVQKKKNCDTGVTNMALNCCACITIMISCIIFSVKIMMWLKRSFITFRGRLLQVYSKSARC